MLQEEPPPSFVAGLFIPSQQEDAATLLSNARTDGYDFCVTSLSAVSPTPKVRTDVCKLESTWWSTSIVGALMHTGTTHNLSVAEEEHIERMVRWACHMNIPAIILPLASNIDSRLITRLSLIASASNLQIWMRVRLVPAELEKMNVLLRRCAGSGGGNLGICLEFSPGNVASSSAVAAHAAPHTMYTLTQMLQLLHAVMSMNLKAVSFDTQSFMTNKRGYPTLAKVMQFGFLYVLKRLGRTIRVLVEGPPSHTPVPSSGIALPAGSTDLVGASGLLPYLQYLRHLRQRPEVTSLLDSPAATMETSYLDHLQSPLQPLGDDLEFATYETFEKDPVKYKQYELAIQQAIHALMMAGDTLKMVSPHAGAAAAAAGRPSYVVTLMVLGAGRGPLVTCALNAAAKLNATSLIGTVAIKVVAMDKNPNAIVYLRSLLASHHSTLQSQQMDVHDNGALWTPDKVQIMQCDMRSALQHPAMIQWQNDARMNRAQRVDILVSELLGSFGDNELSPECLEGAIDAMNRMGLLMKHCISIPQSYTSYISPVSSARLHSEAKGQAYSQPSSVMDGPMGQPMGFLKAMETPYVVRSHAASQTHPEKPIFKFEHVAFGARDDGYRQQIGGGTAQFNKRNTIRFSPEETVAAFASGSGYGPRKEELPPDAAMSQSPINSFQLGTTIHGLLGTFEAVLFDRVTISIAPSSFSEGMFSWFPLYFPIREPVYAPYNASIVASVWRRCDDETNRVWYEWGVDVTTAKEQGNPEQQIISCSAIHNPGGRSYYVRL